jgi:NAD(P)-dependent dehydrogenase (short-subunit alcohol dehydrogenase family)
MPRNIVITGGSLGLGRALAEAFVRAGDHLVLCARTSGPLEKAAHELIALAQPGQKILVQPCDVSDEGQVRALADFTARELGPCGVLVNNAGVQGPIGPLDEVDWAEWKRAIEIDLCGVALPCRAFIPQMKRRGSGKIINLSGGGATKPRPFYSAYAAAKTAVVRLTETLGEELRSFQIDVNAIAPGPVKTRMTAETIAAGPEKAGAVAHAAALRHNREGGSAAERAAELCVFLASAESNGISGRLISARWDDWKALPRRRSELAETDLYTLRRIVPPGAPS